MWLFKLGICRYVDKLGKNTLRLVFSFLCCFSSFSAASPTFYPANDRCVVLVVVAVGVLAAIAVIVVVVALVGGMAQIHIVYIEYLVYRIYLPKLSLLAYTYTSGILSI